MAETPPGFSNKHSPRLVNRPDGRFEIRCPQCERMDDQAPPIGIGLPIANRTQAESIARNHGHALPDAAVEAVFSYAPP
jgi:hypothetical protein